MNAKNPNLELSTLFEDENGHDLHFRIVNIVNEIRTKNNNAYQPLKFYFIK